MNLGLEDFSSIKELSIKLISKFNVITIKFSFFRGLRFSTRSYIYYCNYDSFLFTNRKLFLLPLLTLFFPMFSFDKSENQRCPDAFREDKREHWEEKG